MARNFFPRDKAPKSKFGHTRAREAPSHKDLTELQRAVGEIDPGTRPDVLLRKIKRSNRFCDSQELGDGRFKIASKTGWVANHTVTSLQGLLQGG
jgi:hypothetical protein